MSAALAAPVLVRATYESPIHNRSRYAEKARVKLWAHREHQPRAGRFAREIPARRGTTPALPRAPRGATVELRFVAFKLNPPQRLSATRPDLALSAIDVREQDPPADEQPLEGRLRTTLKSDNCAQADEKVQGYCLRGRLEL